MPFLLDVPSQGTAPTPNQEFYIRQPNLEPRIPKYSIDHVNPNISRFIYSKKYKPKPEVSQREALQSKYWLVKELDDEQDNSSQLYRVSEAVLEARKDFPGTSRMVIGLPQVDC